MKRKQISTEEIDNFVISQAEDESAWEPPIEVRQTKSEPFSLSPELAERVSFLARVHHAARVEEWLISIIRERVELEEVAFAAVKRAIQANMETTSVS
ncbi:conserved hypothetical protein [Gammaproteobacteria bacterium]